MRLASFPSSLSPFKPPNQVKVGAFDWNSEKWCSMGKRQSDRPFISLTWRQNLWLYVFLRGFKLQKPSYDIWGKEPLLPQRKEVKPRGPVMSHAVFLISPRRNCRCFRCMKPIILRGLLGRKNARHACCCHLTDNWNVCCHLATCQTSICLHIWFQCNVTRRAFCSLAF